MCIPVPFSDQGVYAKEATGFSDWSTATTNSKEILPMILKKVFLMTAVSLSQLDKGTPPLIKTPFLERQRYADYIKYAYTVAYGKRTPKPEAFAENGMNGTVVFDPDVARHLEFLETHTKHLPETPKRKKKNDDQQRDDDIPAQRRTIDAPIPKKPTTPVVRKKFHVLVQPCRHVKNSNELAGFLFWVFIEDPNFNLDECRSEYVNALAKHKAEITSKSFPSKACRLSNYVKYDISAMATEDATMLSITHRDWVQWCNSYNLAVDFAAEDLKHTAYDRTTQDQIFGDRGADGSSTVPSGSEDGSSEENDFDEERSSREDEEEGSEMNTDSPSFLNLRGYEDEISKPSSSSDYSFFNVFAPHRAMILAKFFGMDTKHAFDCIESTQSEKYDDCVKYSIKPKKKNGISENVSVSDDAVGRTMYLHPYDNIYHMEEEYFYWDRNDATGLKYANFPWVTADTNPIYKRVVIALPPEYKKYENSIRSSLIEINYDRSLEQESNTSSLSRNGGGKKRPSEDALSLEDRNLPNSPRLLDHDGESEEMTTTDSQHAMSKEREEEAFRRKRAKIAGNKYFSLTTSMLQTANLNGMNVNALTINGHKVFKDPNLRDNKEIEHATLTFSAWAEKDDLWKLKEMLAGWKSSIDRYSTIAILDSTPPKSKDLGARHWVENKTVYACGDIVVYEPSEFLQSYHKETAALRRDACNRMIHVFKRRSQSLMTVAVANLADFYLKTIHNNVAEVRNLRLTQTDFDESLFSCLIRKQSMQLRYVCEIISNFKEFHVLYYGVMDVYRMEANVHFNYLGSGEGGVGKSFLLALLNSLLVKGTVREYLAASTKAAYTDLSRCDDIVLADELPANMAGEKAGTNDRSGYTRLATVNESKSAISTAMHIYEVFEFFELENGLKGRTNRLVQTPAIMSWVIVSNGVGSLDKALRDRFHSSSFTNTIQTENEKKASIANGENEADDQCDKLTILDIKTQMKSQNDAQMLHTRFRYSAFQALHMVAEKLIGIGALPQPDMSLANLVFNKVCKYVSSKTGVAIGMRSHSRIINVIRSMVIEDALNNAFFVTARDRDVINENTLLCIAPYLFSQFHHCVFAITLLMDQIFNPYFNCVLYAVIKRHCKFPLKAWVERLKEKRTIVRDDRRRIVRNGENGDGDVVMGDVNIDEPQTEETVDYILRDFYRTDHFNNGETNTIQWKTSYDENGGDKEPEKRKERLVDLNYVEITTTEISALASVIQYKMTPKISTSDIDEIVLQMINTRIRVSDAPKPISHEDLLSPNNCGKLPCYEEKREFNVLERIQSNVAGNRCYKWFFCVHMLTDLTNGENLIMDALKSLSYRGFKPRERVLTGFVKSYQQATLKYVPFESNDEVTAFVSKNASYRSEEVRREFGLNECVQNAYMGHSANIEDTMEYSNPIYSKSKIVIKEDLDDWSAKQWALKSALPIVWVRKRRNGDVAEKKALTNPRLEELEMKWKYLRSNGSIEIRDLPTELNQRRRNLDVTRKDEKLRKIIEGIHLRTKQSWGSLVRDEYVTRIVDALSMEPIEK
jgi:hypothetical protein